MEEWIDWCDWGIYDADSDVMEGLFPKKFRKHVQEQNLICRGLTNWGIATNRTDFWIFKYNNQPYAHLVTSAYRSLARKMTRIFQDVFLPKCLVQFWRAEQVEANSANDFGFQLTTRNQPFLLGGFSWGKPFSEGICSYRMKTCDVIITGDGRGGGPISRAFKNNRMEFTPNVAYYSYEEYPLRDLALSCHISCSLIVPLSDSYGHTVGVTEFVLQLNWPPHYFMDAFLLTLPESDLMYLNPCKGLCGQYDLDKDSLRIAVSEIKEVIGVLCRSFDIVIAQTWMLCKHCNSLTTSEGCAKELGASYQRFTESTEYPYVNLGCYCILREGEGVVGRAAVSSHNMVYCENVTKFTITEYPLAYFVRKNNLSASFAICLQSNLSGDQVYVLEFFLGPSYISWGLREKLVPILDKMRQWFRTFKVAYRGEEIGDNLSAQVVDAIFPGTVERGEEIGDNLYVQVIDANFPDRVETLKKKSMDLNLAIGAKNVEAFNLPYYLQQSIGESSINETDDPMIGVETPFQDISVDDVPVASAFTVQSEIKVTVKANYGGDFVRFQLFASSGIHELHQQVSQRLELTKGTYDLSYRDDDNDLILLACDEDLQFYISSLTEQGIYTLIVSIEPKPASPL